MPFDRSLAGQWTAPVASEVTWKDTALYALGVGAKREELDFLYEGRGPKVLPSFAVVPKFQPMLDLLAKSGGDLSHDRPQRRAGHGARAARAPRHARDPRRDTRILRHAPVRPGARRRPDGGRSRAARRRDDVDDAVSRPGRLRGRAAPQGERRPSRGRRTRRRRSRSKRLPLPSRRYSIACQATTTRFTPTPTSRAA